MVQYSSLYQFTPEGLDAFQKVFWERLMRRPLIHVTRRSPSGSRERSLSRRSPTVLPRPWLPTFWPP